MNQKSGKFWLMLVTIVVSAGNAGIELSHAMATARAVAGKLDPAEPFR